MAQRSQGPRRQHERAAQAIGLIEEWWDQDNQRILGTVVPRCDRQAIFGDAVQRRAFMRMKASSPP